MFLTIFILLFSISIIFMYFGFVLDDITFKVVGFGVLTFIFVSISISGLSYSNGTVTEICTPMVESFTELYVYGDNYTGYHWDYANEPPPEFNDVNLFHVNRTNYYTDYCYNQTLEPTEDIYLQRTVFIVLSVFALFGALVFPFLEYKSWGKNDGT